MYVIIVVVQFVIIIYYDLPGLGEAKKYWSGRIGTLSKGVYTVCEHALLLGGVWGHPPGNFAKFFLKVNF